MKKFLMSFLLVAGAGWPLHARSTCQVHLSITHAPDSMVYLAHYYGLGGPQIYVADSARLSKKGTAVLSVTDTDFVGGIYMVLFKDEQRTNFELLLNPGDNFTVTADKADLPGSVHFTQAPENDRFLQYLADTRTYGTQQQQLTEQLGKATSKADTDAVQQQARTLATTRKQYMANYATKYKGSLLATIFEAMQTPDIPTGTHYLPDGHTPDSNFAYHWYKQHYWDGFNLRDDRLMYTPLYDSRLSEYFNRLTVPMPDSVERDADSLLARVAGTRHLYHYTLHWLTRFAETSKIMGMDEVFVYLVERYYVTGTAFWLTREQLQQYEDRAQAIAPNVIGKIAPEVRLPDVFTQQERRLHNITAPYTLLVFYSPNCGHCQHELPLLDSLYEARLKDQGVQVFTVANEGDDKQVAEFLRKNKLDKKWIHTWVSPTSPNDYRRNYDVYSTPTIYLLNERKLIKGKRLDHTNIGSLIDMLEKQKM
ncbi:MAG: DUF5106 domain-containing protein, partial [Chitinophagia bacterium]|nr:DUF5106 domain-containing protein [Chitinophagia bacterium]